jgi:hypothetical protein
VLSTKPAGQNHTNTDTRRQSRLQGHTVQLECLAKHARQQQLGAVHRVPLGRERVPQPLVLWYSKDEGNNDSNPVQPLPNETNAYRRWPWLYPLPVHACSHEMMRVLSSYREGEEASGLPPAQATMSFMSPGEGMTLGVTCTA